MSNEELGKAIGVGAVNIILLAVVFAGVKHYTDHWCIAGSSVAALMYLVGTRRG